MTAIGPARALALAAPLLALPLWAQEAGAATLSERYTGLVVLGDSLSDPGNLFAATEGASPPSPPYVEGRASSGPVFAEYLAEGFAASANLAFGGAQAVPDDDGIPDLPEQLGLLASFPEGAFGEAGLATILLGANDLFAAIGTGPVAETATAAADAVIQGARSVLDLGLSEVAVLTLPDLALTPLYTLFQPELRDEAALAADLFNARLDEGLAALDAEGLALTRVDTRAFFADLLSDPGAYGIEEPLIPCLFPSAEAAAAFGQEPLCDLATEAPRRAYFDGVHPSGTVHAAFADYVEAALVPAPIPVPAGGFLALGGLLALGALGRRRGRRA